MFGRMRTMAALLVNEKENRWTVHRFVEERPITTAHGAVIGYEQIYRCTETGVERRWGVSHWASDDMEKLS